MKVRTRFSPHQDFFAPSPDGIAIEYTEQILKDGTMGLVPSGKHDLNEFVQASLEGSKVYTILDRFARTNDPSVLDAVRGFSADVSGFPTNLMEAQNLKLSIDKQFSLLPADIRSKFHNNSFEFADAVLSGKISEAFVDSAQNSSSPAAEKIVENELKEGATE